MTCIFHISRRGLLALATPVAWSDGVRDAGDFVTVRIVDFAFEPAVLRIAVGQGVMWRNDDDVPHSVIHAGHPHLFRSRVLFRGDGFSRQFNVAGEFPYRCGIHPHMRASVIVG